MIICICGEGQPKQRIHNVYYLPGDVKMIFAPYDIEQFNEALRNIRALMQQLMENMQPIVENMVKKFREVAMLSPFQELESIKDAIKELKEKYLPREPLPRPLKSIKAVNLNKCVNKIIYYHIRSNC